MHCVLINYPAAEDRQWDAIVTRISLVSVSLTSVALRTSRPSAWPFQSGELGTLRPVWPDCLPQDIAPTSTRTSDARPKVHRAHLFQGRSSAPASHRQRTRLPSGTKHHLQTRCPVWLSSSMLVWVPWRIR